MAKQVTFGSESRAKLVEGVDILEGNGSKYLRISSDYRKHTREAKY